MNANQPRPGEVPFKQWLADKATELGMAPKGVYRRLFQNKHATMRRPKMRRVNARVIYVRV